MLKKFARRPAQYAVWHPNLSAAMVYSLLQNFECNISITRRKMREFLKFENLKHLYHRFIFSAPGAVCTPFTTFPDLCTNAQTAPTALEKCPGTCGLCNRPGALGGCPDMVTNCVQLLPLLTCTNAYMQVNCMRTCNITTCICKFFILSILFTSLNFFYFKKVFLTSNYT